MQTQTFFRLEKFNPFEGIAIGVAAAEEPDGDQEVLYYSGSKPYFQNWSNSVLRDSEGKSYVNVLFQHDNKRPVGRLIAPLEFDDAKKQVRVSAKIEEPQARSMLANGVLTGFSVGGSYVSKSPMGNGLTSYIAKPAEISVVDRPCAPSATFQVVKRDGSLQKRYFATTYDARTLAKVVAVAALAAALSKNAARLNRNAAATDTMFIM